MGQFFLQGQWLVRALAVAITVFLTAGALRLTLNAEHRVLFPDDDPERLQLESFEDLFAINDDVFLILEPNGGDAFTPKALETVRWIAQNASAKIPNVRRVDSVADFQNSVNKNGTLSVQPLVPEAGEITDAIAAEAKRIALDTPELVNYAVSKTGHVTAINVMFTYASRDGLDFESSYSADEPTAAATDPFATFDEPLTTSRLNSPEAYAALNAKKEATLSATKAFMQEISAKYPDIKFYFSGRSMLSDAFTVASINDYSLLYPLMLFVMLLVFWLITRSWSALGMLLVVIFTAIPATMGVFGWLGYQINAATVPTPIVLLILANLACIHLVASIRFQYAQTSDRTQALSAAVSKSLWPIFFASLTTAIGALTLNFSESPPLRTFGNMLAVGMALIFIQTYVLGLPIIRRFPVNPKAGTFLQPLFARFSDFVIQRKTAILISTAIASVVVSLGITRAVFNDKLSHYFGPDVPFRQASDFGEQHLTGTDHIEFVFDTGVEDGIFEPEFLAQTQAFATWLRSKDEVSYVYSVLDILRRVNKTLNFTDEVQQDATQAAQHLLSYSSGLPLNKGIDTAVDLNNRYARMHVSLRGMKTADVRDFATMSSAWLDTNAPALVVTVTGSPLVFANLTIKNAQTMTYGTFVALALITLIMRIAMRSWRMVWISLVPNLVPIALTLGVWGWLVGEMNLAATVFVAFTLGIVVDDTIHFMIAYDRRRRIGESAEQAIRDTFVHVGPALMTTTIVIMLGFAVLSLSGFAYNSALGLMSLITVGFALATDFLLLPTLLLVLDKDPRDNSEFESA